VYFDKVVGVFVRFSCATSTDATFTSIADIRLPVVRLGFSWSFS
jgi:hypothetical protein